MSTDARLELFRKHKGSCKTFVETGTQHGAGIIAAIKAGFSNIKSFEKSQKLAQEAQDIFESNVHVHIINESSTGTLFGNLVAELKEPAVFWLDAHRMDGNGKGIEDYPLRHEIRMLMQKMKVPHTILCDDRRLFERYDATEDLILGKLNSTKWAYGLSYDTSKSSLPFDVAVYTPEV